MSRDFDGLVAAVTGGGSGIGLATALHLAGAGARVTAIDLNPAAVPDHIDAVTTDLTDDRSVRAAIDAVIDRHGQLDILVNNAGIGARGAADENPDDEWHRVWDVNVVGIVRTTRAALPHLRRSERAVIVNTCSVAASTGIKQRALYSATKGAVEALTRAMAADYLQDGIRVNCVNPGTADTPWVQRLLNAASDPAAERTALEARQPIGRLISAEEVALAIAYLANPRAASTTATVLPVDGGMHSLA